MLSMEQIQANKMKYIELITKLGIDPAPLLKYLEVVDYFNMPYAVQGLYSYAGGLCEYALNLYYEMSQLTPAYTTIYTEEDVIKVALFKDIYRAELYEAGTKRALDETTGIWQTISIFKYKEERPTFGDLYFSSYMVAKYFITFTDAQIEAIVQACSKESYAGDIHDIRKSYPLVTLTLMGHLAAMYLQQ